MSAQPLDTPNPNVPPPEWIYRLGIDQPETCAASLVQSLIDDPFYVIGFVAVATAHLRDQFDDLVDRLAAVEPTLRTALPAVAATMAPTEASVAAPAATAATLPQWLREIDRLECTGIMHRYDLADRSTSSYLIEARLAGGQIATARLSLDHQSQHNKSAARVSEFWTTGLSLPDAAEFYRERYTYYTKRPYRLVEVTEAAEQILEAVGASFADSELIAEEMGHPIPWPQNVAVLLLMLRSVSIASDTADCLPGLRT